MHHPTLRCSNFGTHRSSTTSPASLISGPMSACRSRERSLILNECRESACRVQSLIEIPERQCPHVFFKKSAQELTFENIYLTKLQPCKTTLRSNVR